MGGFEGSLAGALLLKAYSKRVLGAEPPRLCRSVLAGFLAAAAVVEGAEVRRLGRRGSPLGVEVAKATYRRDGSHCCWEPAGAKEEATEAEQAAEEAEQAAGEAGEAGLVAAASRTALRL